MTAQLNEETHVYTNNGKTLPSVTQILRPLMGDLRFVKSDILEHKSQLGQAVHKAIELHLIDQLDYTSVPNIVMPYLNQFLRFEHDTKFVAVDVECVVSHPLGYAGKLDAVGRINNKLGIFDWKTTTTLSPVVALQTAAYATAHKFGITERYALRLSESNYRLHKYPASEHVSDFQTFTGLLRLHHWCETHNKEILL